MKCIYKLSATFLILLVFPVWPAMAQDYQTHLDRGDAMIDLRQYDQAIADYGEAAPYLQRGKAYGMQGKYRMAIYDLNVAIKKNPKNADGYSLRGLVYKFQANYDEAIEHLKSYESNKPWREK